MANNCTAILKQLLDKIEAQIPNKDLKNISVSKSDIGWQLDHALKVFNAVSEWTQQSNPSDYKSSFNGMRLVLFTLGYIPRGKAKAPKKVLPPDSITVENLETQIQTAKAHTEKLKTLHENAYFQHHVFGMINKKQTIRFLEIHTNHHLKIVNDILKK